MDTPIYDQDSSSVDDQDVEINEIEDKSSMQKSLWVAVVLKANAVFDSDDKIKTIFNNAFDNRVKEFNKDSQLLKNHIYALVQVISLNPMNAVRTVMSHTHQQIVNTITENQEKEIENQEKENKNQENTNKKTKKPKIKKYYCIQIGERITIRKAIELKSNINYSAVTMPEFSAIMRDAAIKGTKFVDQIERICKICIDPDQIQLLMEHKTKHIIIGKNSTIVNPSKTVL